MYINPYIKDLYRIKFQDERHNVLRLDMNENPGGLPYEFVNIVQEKITPEYLATYPEKDRLTRIISEHNHIPSECITITNGSSEAINLAFQCFGQAGKDVVSIMPTFEMYGVFTRMYGMNHITVQYNDDFTISAERILAAINENTGILILLNPNSPIGAVYTLDEACAIIEKANKFNAVVLIDEAYHYFYKQTFIPLIHKYQNVVIFRTFSKLCSIAGLRIGYAGGNPQMIDYLEKAAPTFNVNTVAILFAEEILQRPDIMEQQRLAEEEGHKWLTDQLTQAGYQVLSLEGNFILFKPPRPSGEIVAELKEKGIWIRDYSSGILKGFIRVSTGSKECMEKFYNSLTEIC